MNAEQIASTLAKQDKMMTEINPITETVDPVLESRVKAFEEAFNQGYELGRIAGRIEAKEQEQQKLIEALGL